MSSNWNGCDLIDVEYRPFVRDIGYVDQVIMNVIVIVIMIMIMIMTK